MHEESEVIPTYKTELYKKLRRKLPLDLLGISEDVQEIAQLIQMAGEISATANEIREATKEDLERTISQEAEKLRLIPTPKGKDRSESMIASQVQLSDLVAEKKKDLGEARLDAALWNTLVDGLRSKSAMIRVTADLLNSGYLTSSSILEKRREDIRNA
jgi:hypothetical protein